LVQVAEFVVASWGAGFWVFWLLRLGLYLLFFGVWLGLWLLLFWFFGVFVSDVFLFWSWWLGNVSWGFEEFGSCPYERHCRDCSSEVRHVHLGDGFVPDEDFVGYPAEEPTVEK
jgi:hypothetical protein